MARDITQLHPELQKKANQLVSECAKQGLTIKITDCVRNATEQQDCVDRGTSSVRYPNSHHNWGNAFDFCRNDGAGAYDESGNFFNRVGRIGQNLGLEWGGAWTSPVDKPHFQLPNWGSSTAVLKANFGNPDNFKKTWVAKKDGYIVQMGIFDDLEKAKILGNELIGMGHKNSTSIETLKDYYGKGKDGYIVQTGVFEDKTQAMGLGNHLLSMGHSTSIKTV